jgi:hypothetical protein
LDPLTMRVTCTAPAARRPHLAELRVSLDSQVSFLADNQGG